MLTVGIQKKTRKKKKKVFQLKATRFENTMWVPLALSTKE